jgi:predicted transcriptional regulator
MKALSLKLKDEISDDVERIIKTIHVSRNAYINQAVQFYNTLNKREALREKLRKESSIASATSLEVLREMEELDEHSVK